MVCMWGGGGKGGWGGTGTSRRKPASEGLVLDGGRLLAPGAATGGGEASGAWAMPDALVSILG